MSVSPFEGDISSADVIECWCVVQVRREEIEVDFSDCVNCGLEIFVFNLHC